MVRKKMSAKITRRNFKISMFGVWLNVISNLGFVKLFVSLAFRVIWGYIADLNIAPIFKLAETGNDVY